MTTYIRRSCLLLAVVLLAACDDRITATRGYAVLSDGRSGGAEGFYFLPPVAPAPAEETRNDLGLSPVVEIAALENGAPVLARFEGDAVKESGGHYMVHWSTRLVPPVFGTIYRIRVLLDGEELGFADAQVARNGTELHLLGSNEIFGLTGQRTVPIKFRIHVAPQDPCDGIVCDAPAACEASVACDPAIAACVANALPSGTACDDADACTVGDACDGEGACTAGAPLVCTDLDTCNKATGCDPLTGCVYQHLVGTPCKLTFNGNLVDGICAAGGEGGRSICVLPPPQKLTR